MGNISYRILMQNFAITGLITTYYSYAAFEPVQETLVPNPLKGSLDISYKGRSVVN